ncbi:hypothetical protein A1O1_06856 [Capronia coronata CBS 617.96]|uniref:Uncharacterized protein n=1 Tax=Capronia coronata CBS 617.96 TaxID=1182541 RepID=W9XRP2_9EURO|nr:uncharacterized protein A1O1_06856 [Capronia coronata CBS 617.96]EXJ83237.1 hypothetical protein A1O1_06856 [Capronia coronata CBS 617.96]
MGFPDAAVGVISLFAFVFLLIALFSIRDCIRGMKWRPRSSQEGRSEEGLAGLYDISDTELENISPNPSSQSPVHDPASRLSRPPRAARELRRTVSRAGIVFATSSRTTVYNHWDSVTGSSVSDSRTTASTASIPPPYPRSDESELPRYERNPNRMGSAPSVGSRLPAYESNLNLGEEAQSVTETHMPRHEELPTASSTPSTMSPPPRRSLYLFPRPPPIHRHNPDQDVSVDDSVDKRLPSDNATR